MSAVPVSTWVIGICSEHKRCVEAFPKISDTHRILPCGTHAGASHLDPASLTHIVVTSELLLETLVPEECQSGAPLMGCPHAHPSLPAPSYPFLF